MTQITNFSLQEFELFLSFRSQLDDSFNLYKQNNLAISNQETELIKIKTETENALESFVIQKKNSARMILKQLRKKLNFKKYFYRRNIISATKHVEELDTI